MNWTTLYISGKSGFHEEVLHQLEQSDLSFMPGSSDDSELALFWIDETENLRNVKKAIGSKTVFKYRLQFFNSVEESERSKSQKTTNDFTHEEREMIKRITERSRNRLAYRKVISN